jgi:hypothetical protein
LNVREAHTRLWLIVGTGSDLAFVTLLGLFYL